MSYSSAIMTIPRAAFLSIARGFEEAGYDRQCFTADPTGRGVAVVALDMEGIMVVPDPMDTSDVSVNSGAMSDAIIAACKEAFDAGHEAAMKLSVPALFQDPTHNPAETREKGWSEFTPAQEIIDALHAAA